MNCIIQGKLGESRVPGFRDMAETWKRLSEPIRRSAPEPLAWCLVGATLRKRVAI